MLCRSGGKKIIREAEGLEFNSYGPEGLVVLANYFFRFLQPELKVGIFRSVLAVPVSQPGL